MYDVIPNIHYAAYKPVVELREGRENSYSFLACLMVSVSQITSVLVRKSCVVNDLSSHNSCILTWKIPDRTLWEVCPGRYNFSSLVCLPIAYPPLRLTFSKTWIFHMGVRLPIYNFLLNFRVSDNVIEKSISSFLSLLEHILWNLSNI